MRRGLLAAFALLAAAGARAGMRTEEVWIPMKDGVRLAATQANEHSWRPIGEPNGRTMKSAPSF